MMFLQVQRATQLASPTASNDATPNRHPCDPDHSMMFHKLQWGVGAVDAGTRPVRPCGSSSAVPTASSLSSATNWPGPGNRQRDVEPRSKAHLTRLMAKLDVTNRTHVAVLLHDAD